MRNKLFSFQEPAFYLISLLGLCTPFNSYGMTAEELKSVEEKISWVQQVLGRATLDDSPQGQKVLSILPTATELGRTIEDKYNSAQYEIEYKLNRANETVKDLEEENKASEGYKRYFRKKTDLEKEKYARRDELRKQMSGINKELAALLKQFRKQIAMVETYDKQAQKRGLKATLEHPHTQEFRSKCLRENIVGVEKPATGLLGFFKRLFGKPALGHLTQADLEGKTLLTSAVLNGKEDLVAAFIQQNGNLNVKGENPNDPVTFGKTPAVIALEQGKYKIARLLIEGGADTTATATNDGRRPVDIVTDIARPVNKNNKYLRLTNPEVAGNTEFRDLVKTIAVKTSTQDLVGAAKSYFESSTGQNLGTDLLQWSLDNGHGDVAIELIRKGVDLSSAPYVEKYRHLFGLADRSLKLSPVEMEIAKRVILQSTMSYNPSMAAFDTMVQLGAKVPPPGSDGFPLGLLLHRAGQANEPKDLEERETLLKLADKVIADVKPEDWVKVPSLLMDTVALNSKERLQNIYEKVGKAGIDFVDGRGRTALDNAILFKAWDSFDFLTANGAKIKQDPSVQKTRLMDAVEAGDLITTQKLLPHLKADPEQINRSFTQTIKMSEFYNKTKAVKWTAYDLALANLKDFNPAVITELEKAGAKGVPVEGLNPEFEKKFREILELPAEGQLTRLKIAEAAKKIYDGLDHGYNYSQVRYNKNPALAKASGTRDMQYGGGVLAALNRANQELQRSVPGP